MNNVTFKTLFFISIIAVFFAFSQDDGHDHKSHAGEDHSQFVQKMCPVMGNPIDQNLFVENGDDRIYLCCEACRGEVKDNFTKYAKMLTDQGIHLSEHLHSKDQEHEHGEDCDHDSKNEKKKKRGSKSNSDY